MWKVSVRKCTQVTCHQTQQAGARRKAWQGEKVSGLWKMWNKIQIKVWIDRHVKTHEKKPSHENQVKKVKSAAGFGIFVREKSVRVSDKYLWNECSKTFNSAFSLKRHMVSGLHKQKPKKKKSRTTVMRRVRKFLSESENLKEIKRQRKSSDTSGLIDATLIEEIMAQIPQISNRNILKTLTTLRKKLPKEAFQLSQNSVCHRLRALSEPLAFRILWHFG